MIHAGQLEPQSNSMPSLCGRYGNCVTNQDGVMDTYHARMDELANMFHNNSGENDSVFQSASSSSNVASHGNSGSAQVDNIVHELNGKIPEGDHDEDDMAVLESDCSSQDDLDFPLHPTDSDEDAAKQVDMAYEKAMIQWDN